MKDKFKPYSKNLELVSGNYKLKYSDDDNEVVYAWYCAKAKRFVIDIDVYDLDSVYKDIIYHKQERKVKLNMFGLMKERR